MKKIIYILSVLILLGGLIISFNPYENDICVKVGLPGKNIDICGDNGGSCTENSGRMIFVQPLDYLSDKTMAYIQPNDYLADEVLILSVDKTPVLSAKDLQNTGKNPDKIMNLVNAVPYTIPADTVYTSTTPQYLLNVPAETEYTSIMPLFNGNASDTKFVKLDNLESGHIDGKAFKNLNGNIDKIEGSDGKIDMLKEYKLAEKLTNMKVSENDKLNLNAKSYFLMDFNTGKTLAGSNETDHYEVASIVKLMTALLTIEKLEKNEWNLDTKLMTSTYAASMEGSQAFLDAGYQYTVDELLKSIIVASANDSSVVIAENMMGSEQNFVNLMNKRAEELGLSNTLYANSTGLPATSQYSCARDTAILLKEVHKHDIYHKYSTIWMDKLIHESGRETELVNTNRLIKYYPGCDSGKTGFTDEAGYCLSASAERNGMRLISVVLGTKTSQERFETSSNLLNYGFSNYENKRIVNKDIPFEETFKVKGIREPVSVRCERDIFELVRRGDPSKSEIKIEMDKNIRSPISKECVVGRVYLVENGVVVEECNLLSSDEHLKIGYWGAFRQALDNWRF